MLSYVAMHSKQHKTTKVIKITMNCIDLMSKRSKILSCVNIQKLQKWSNYNELHRLDVKTIKNVALSRKTFKTTQNYKSDQITMNCIDLTSKRSKILSYVAKHSKQRKTTKVIKIQLLASIRRRKDKKCRVKSQNIKTTPNYESDQIIMNCIDLTS